MSPGLRAIGTVSSGRRAGALEGPANEEAFVPTAKSNVVVDTMAPGWRVQQEPQVRWVATVRGPTRSKAEQILGPRFRNHGQAAFDTVPTPRRAGALDTEVRYRRIELSAIGPMGHAIRPTYDGSAFEDGSGLVDIDQASARRMLCWATRARTSFWPRSRTSCATRSLHRNSLQTYGEESGSKSRGGTDRPECPEMFRLTTISSWTASRRTLQARRRARPVWPPRCARRRDEQHNIKSSGKTDVTLPMSRGTSRMIGRLAQVFGNGQQRGQVTEEDGTIRLSAGATGRRCVTVEITARGSRRNTCRTCENSLAEARNDGPRGSASTISGERDGACTAEVSPRKAREKQGPAPWWSAGGARSRAVPERPIDIRRPSR